VSCNMLLNANSPLPQYASVLFVLVEVCAFAVNRAQQAMHMLRQILTSLPEEFTFCLYFMLCQLNALCIIARLYCRRELHNQQPPISGRMAADELLSDEQKEEVSSATAAQHHGGDSGLDNSMRESKQPR